MISTREFLKPNSKIKLINESSKGEETFTIKSIVGEGGSSVCYRAARGKLKGLLKEFYPDSFTNRLCTLRRTKNKQLVASDEKSAVNFDKLKKNFISSFNLLSEISFSDDANLLNNYIPSFECFDGTEDNSTVYIWCKENSGYTFSDYIDSAWESPENNSAFKLYNIIATIRTITGAIVAMHKNGLLHRDIKPDNFLVFKDGLGNINPNNISVFDINSFSYGSRSTLIVGTEGFMAPEVLKGKASYYSDIFSLGATLFYALTKKKFHTEDYLKLDSITEESPFMKTNDIYLKTTITGILQKTLARLPAERFEKTEQLVMELDKILVRLLPYTESRKLSSNQKLKIIEDKTPVDAIPVFQNLLYKHPVYEHLPETAETINILVIGGGLYSQAFIDTALQTLQLKNKTLNITVVSAEPLYDKSIYLKYRPDLCRFYDIDKKEPDPTSYGRINYIEGEFDAKSHSNDEFISSLVKKTNPCYVLVSLDNDMLNHTVAKTIADTDADATVNFVWSGDEKRFTKGNPVYISRKNTYKNIDSEPLRMAFNTHLVWNDSTDADINILYNEFKNPYNYKASISFALSIPYKLYSMGISLKEAMADPDIVCFDTANPETATFLDELSWIEHRRWVTEKIVNGWTAPLDENGNPDTALCLGFHDNKSSALKQHLCITKSNLAESIEGIDWDTADISAADPLDRVSIEIYRHFKSESDNTKKDYYLINKTMLAETRKHLPTDNHNLIQLFNEYEIALNAIVQEDNIIYSSKLRFIHDRLADEIKNIVNNEKENILYALNEIYKKMQPLILCNKKTDYKALDSILIKNIPYIISNYPRPKIAAVFNDGYRGICSNNDIFTNISSAAVIIPKHIKYLYYCSEQTNTPDLLNSILGVISFFRNKHMKNTLEFVFVSRDTIDQKIYSEFKNNNNLKSIKASFYENRSPAKAIQIFKKETSNNYLVDGTNKPFAKKSDNDKYTTEMSKGKYYEFNPPEMKFENITNCKFLKYLDTEKTTLMVSDMFALKKTNCLFYTPDMAALYQSLWEVYTGIGTGKTLRASTEAWHSLSEKLEGYSSKKDLVTTLVTEIPHPLEINIKKILPIECKPNAKYIIDTLLRSGFIRSGEVTLLNSDSFMIDIHCNNIYRNIGSIFSDYEILRGKISVNSYLRNNIRYINIFRNNLKVENIILKQNEYECLLNLAERYFINNLTVNSKNSGEITTYYDVSFSYASEGIKKILMIPESILKLHTYYAIITTGYFDDVKTSVTVQSGEYSHEFDLVLTKGMRSVFVEFKQSNYSGQEFYNKVRKVTSYYGINSTTVIVSGEKTIGNSSDDHNIIKLSSPDEIIDIEDVLIELMEKH